MRSRRPVAQRTMRSLGVVEAPPLLDENFSLPESVADLPVQTFVSELAVEAFIVAVLPSLARQALPCNAERGEPGVMNRVLT